MSVQETFSHSGDNGEGDPPVLIPNTEVKPFSADGTWLDTTRESRSSPVTNKKEIVDSYLFFICNHMIFIDIFVAQCAYFVVDTRSRRF